MFNFDLLQFIFNVFLIASVLEIVLVQNNQIIWFLFEMCILFHMCRFLCHYYISLKIPTKQVKPLLSQKNSVNFLKKLKICPTFIAIATNLQACCYCDESQPLLRLRRKLVFVAITTIGPYSRYCDERQTFTFCFFIINGHFEFFFI